MKTMQAELSNPKHSEYGVATIPFPIPDEEYDHVLELLEPLEIGDYVERDCQVDRLIGVPPILHRLEQTLVNLDELDFLIQRLDSFDYYEMEQFQALAYADSNGPTRRRYRTERRERLYFHSDDVKENYNGGVTNESGNQKLFWANGSGRTESTAV